MPSFIVKILDMITTPIHKVAFPPVHSFKEIYLDYFNALGIENDKITYIIK